MGAQGEPPIPESPPQEPKLLGRKTTEQRAKEVWDLRKKYVNSQELADFLFGTNAREGSVARAAWERLQIKPGYQQEKERVKLLMRQVADNVFTAIQKRFEAEKNLTKENREKLKFVLNEFLNTVGVLGAASRLQKTPYSEQVREDTFATDELVNFKTILEQLRRLDVDELVDMVFEDQAHIDMLVEEINDKKGGMLDPENKGYHEHLQHLADFILGRQEEEKGSKPKSDFRKTAEAMLWQEIVRSMTFDQKQDLVQELLNRAEPREVKKFVARAIITGAMSQVDFEHMVAQQPQEFAKLGENFSDFVKGSVKAGERVREEIKNYVSQIEEPQIQSGISYYLTINNEGAETIGRVGAIAALVNTGLFICDRISRRKETGRSIIGAGVGGFFDAAKDKCVIGGLAAAAWASNVIHPWMEDWAYSASGDEKEKLAIHEAEKFLGEQNDYHSLALDYFVDNYDALLVKARHNERLGGEFELGKGDIKLTPEQIGQFGYDDAADAVGAIHKMFNYCVKVLKMRDGKKIDDSVKLAKFLQDLGEYSEEHSHG